MPSPESSNTTPTASCQQGMAEALTPGLSDDSDSASDTTGDQSASPIVTNEPRAVRGWPASAALVMSWILPATTARRTAHVSLVRAWGVHVVALLLGLPALSVSLTLTNSGARRLDLMYQYFEASILQYFHWLTANPALHLVIATGKFLLIEIAFVAAAVVLMSWGAVDEHVRGSFRHSLTQVWSRTLHLAVAFLIGSLITAWVSDTALQWSAKHAHLEPEYPTLPSFPEVTLSPDDPGYAELKAEVDRLMSIRTTMASEWERAWNAFRAQRPWYVRNSGGVFIITSFCIAFWFVWATLRAIGARRDVPPVVRPPTCELCGYNLTTLQTDARCPECGEPVANSLGPGNRPGAPWDRSTTGWGMFLSLLRTHRMAIRDPARLGRMIPITNWSAAHRWFLAAHLVVIFLIGLGTCACLWWITTGQRSKQADWTEAGLFGTLAGITCLIGAIGWCVGSATVIGLVQSWRCRRNLLPASMRVSAYLAGYLVLWAALGGAMIDLWIMMDRSHFFRQIGDMVGINADFLGVTTWFIPQIACALGHWTLLFRGTSAARYANR